MTLTSTLGSPGIEIREIDNSVRVNSSTATTIYVPGFASQGPVDEVMSIGTIGDFETIYGVPTNAAERYFYYTVKAILDGSGAGTSILCSRLPYGKDGGDTVSSAYTMLAYPAIPVKKSNKKIDFDQYVFDDTSKNNFLEMFKISGKEITASFEDLVLTIDDDFGSDITKVSVTSVVADKVIPATTDVYYLDGTGNSGVEAPEITFDNGITANGQIALELKDNKNHLHFSYTLKKDSVQIGSLYFKVVYDSRDSLEGEKLTGGTVVTDTPATAEEGGTTPSTTIEAVYTSPFEIAQSYVDGDEITYVVGSPVTYQVSLSEYYKIITGELLSWQKDAYDFTNNSSDNSKKFGHFDAIGHAAFIVINTSRSIINSNFEGFYLGITDNTFASPSEDYVYNAIDSVKVTTSVYDAEDDSKMGLIDTIDSTGNFQTLSTNRLSFHLNNNTQGSISHILSRNITSMDISGTEYDDTINMALFRLTKSTDSSDVLKLNYSIREKYNWSFDKSRLKSISGSSKPVSAFVENVVENSNNLTVLMNPYISTKTFVDLDGNIKGKIRVFSNKLVSNLEKFEKKYLCRNTSNSTDATTSSSKKSVSAMIPATMARSSINSWATMIKQVGLTPKFIKTTLTNYNLNNVSTAETAHTYHAFNPLNSIIPFGTYTKQGTTNKLIGNLPAKLERALELVENDEQYPDIDLILEGGLGTIFAYSSSKIVGSEGSNGLALLSEEGDPVTGEGSSTDGTFNETVILQGMEDLRTSRTSFSEEAEDFLQNYVSVQSVFNRFANSMQNGGRGDTFYISDVPRGVVLKGKNTKVCNLYGSILENNSYDFGDTVNHSFSTSVYYPIKHLFDGIVSSYMSTYAQWVRILDNFSSEKVWIPISGYIAANMAATDATYGPWYAAAGLRRGVINGTLDYALSPSISQRTDLYKICINSVPKIPNYGVTIWGIRTMSKKDSAFDQNTCRRTFLYMEKKVKQLLRYYIFEPNTSYTRLQIYNDIYPFMEKIKNSGGIYSYTLVCDTTNNTPDIINNGDLAVSIAAAPTRTAENIIVEFTANKYTEEISAAESIQ